MMSQHHGNFIDDLYEQSESGGGWISWFCELEGHQFFAEVDEQYITDSFNLYGLKAKVSCYTDAMKMILSSESPDSEDLTDQSFLQVYQAAMDLYGLIHARFILSQRGLTLMKEKYLLGVFGYCSRVLCQRQIVLPIGMSQQLSTSRVKVHCPRCQQVYIPRQKHLDIDGAYFGTSFPHIFLQTFQDLVPTVGIGYYIPRIYGFRIFKQKGSKYFKSEEQDYNKAKKQQAMIAHQNAKRKPNQNQQQQLL